MRRRHKSYLFVLIIFALFIGTSIIPAFSIDTSTYNKRDGTESVQPSYDEVANRFETDHHPNHHYTLNQPMKQTTTINGEEWDIVVPDDYPSIQDAINDADDGYRIFVRSGIYHEHIEIDYVSSITLHGESKETTNIDGGSNDHVIEIDDSADGVNVSGFTIRNNGDNNYGVLISSNYNIIQENSIKDNSIGIKIQSSSGNQIWNNIITDNAETGILLDRSYANNITGNKITNNGNNGIKFTYSSLGTTIDNNEISNHNEHGVYLDESSLGNMFTRCTIKNNEYGVLCAGVSDGNLFHQNLFLENTIHAFDSSRDQWDYQGLGNYWDDYTGVDSDGDGIGDTPYKIDGGDNIDRYPIMNQIMINKSQIQKIRDEQYSESKTSLISSTASNSDIVVPDDYPKIQEAVNHANPGDRIYVKSGVYAENIIISMPDITIHGENKKNTLIDGGGDDHVVFVTEDAYGLDISNFTIQNIGKHYTGLYLYSDSTVVGDVIFKDCNIGVALRDNTDNMVRDCEFENNNYGIWTWMCTNTFFEYNVIKNNILDGIAFQWSTSLNITENTISSNKFNGILKISCSKVELYNNIIHYNNEFGLQIFKSNINEIKDNVINNNDNIGISCYNSKRNIIKNNNIFDHCIIYYKHGIDGISLRYFSCDNIIIGNIISNNWHGIYLSHSSNNNTLMQNKIIGNLASSIHLDQYSNNNNIIVNTIKNNGADGIGIASCKNNVISENIIIGNGNYGVELYYSSPNNLITGNNISNNSAAGIYVAHSSNNNNIRNNQVTNHKRYGILLSQSSNTNFIIKNNFIRNKINSYFDDYTFINIWSKNYWSSWDLKKPKPIFGSIHEFILFEIPWVNFDWHPASEPYDIGG